MARGERMRFCDKLHVQGFGGRVAIRDKKETIMDGVTEQRYVKRRCQVKRQACGWSKGLVQRFSGSL